MDTKGKSSTASEFQMIHTKSSEVVNNVVNCVLTCTLSAKYENWKAEERGFSCLFLDLTSSSTCFVCVVENPVNTVHISIPIILHRLR